MELWGRDGRETLHPQRSHQCAIIGIHIIYFNKKVDSDFELSLRKCPDLRPACTRAQYDESADLSLREKSDCHQNCRHNTSFSIIAWTQKSLAFCQVLALEMSSRLFNPRISRPKTYQNGANCD